MVRYNKSTFYLVESRKEKVNYPDSHLDSPLSNFTAGRGASLLVGSQPTTAAEQIDIVDSSIAVTVAGNLLDTVVRVLGNTISQV